MAIETHPFKPYIPAGAKFLFLGTFPPKPEKWSMKFFYPNKINDMWRIMGLIFFGDKNRFWIDKEKRFNIDAIKPFLDEKKIAMYDTAYRVERLKDNASDKFLNIVENVDLMRILQDEPAITVIVSTGEKAATVVAEITGTEVPKVGGFVLLNIGNRVLRHYRMPSTSRAYPLALEKKAEFYRAMFEAEGLELRVQ